MGQVLSAYARHRRASTRTPARRSHRVGAGRAGAPALTGGSRSRAGATTSTSRRGSSAIRRRIPNTIATAFAGFGLLDAYVHGGSRARARGARRRRRVLPPPHRAGARTRPARSSATCPATAPPSTTRTCSPARSSPGSRRRPGIRGALPDVRAGVAHALGLPAAGRLLAVRRARGPRLGRQPPHRLRPGFPLALPRRRRARGRGRRLPARPGVLRRRRCSPRTRPRGSSRPGPIPSTGSAWRSRCTPSRWPHARHLATLGSLGASWTSACERCGEAMGRSSFSATAPGSIARRTCAGLRPRCWTR